MATTRKKRASKWKRSKKPGKSLHVYREPHTAAELGITCAECGSPAEYFDEMRVSRALYATEKAREEHLRGFICEREPRSPKAVKLAVGQSIEREELAEVANS